MLKGAQTEFEKLKTQYHHRELLPSGHSTLNISLPSINLAVKTCKLLAEIKPKRIWCCVDLAQYEKQQRK